MGSPFMRLRRREAMTMSFQALLGSEDELFFDFINEDRELASLTLGLLLKFRP